MGFHVFFELGHEWLDAQARRDGVEEFDDRGPRFAQEPALGPEVADVRRDRHAGLAELFVEDAGARFVRFLVVRCDARALRVDHQLAGVGAAFFDVGFHLLDSLASLAAIHRDAADAQRVPAEQRRVDQLSFHDELGARDCSVDNDDVEEALMFGGDHHFVGWGRAADVDLEVQHPRRAPNDEAAPGLCCSDGVFCVVDRSRRVGHREDQHGQVHGGVENQGADQLHCLSGLLQAAGGGGACGDKGKRGGDKRDEDGPEPFGTLKSDAAGEPAACDGGDKSDGDHAGHETKRGTGERAQCEASGESTGDIAVFRSD